MHSGVDGKQGVGEEKGWRKKREDERFRRYAFVFIILDIDDGEREHAVIIFLLNIDREASTWLDDLHVAAGSVKRAVNNPCEHQNDTDAL